MAGCVLPSGREDGILKYMAKQHSTQYNGGQGHVQTDHRG